MTPYYLMLGITVLFAVLFQYTDERTGVLFTGNSFRLEFSSRCWFRLGMFLPMFLINAFCFFPDSRTDYQHYYGAFLRISAGERPGLDMMYLKLNQVIAALNLPFQSVYFVCSLIGYTFLALCIIEYSRNYAISYLLYFSTGLFFLLGLNQLRQFVAVMIVMYALRYIPREKQFFKYAVVILLASTFHFTALIMIPAYLVLKMRIKVSYILMVSMILLPFNLFFNQVSQFLIKTFRPSFANEAYMNRQLSINYYLVFGALLLTFIIFLYYDQIIEDRPINRVFVNCMFITVIIYLLCSWVPEYQRFAYYFFIPAIFLFPNIVASARNLYLQIMLVTGVCGYYFALIGHRAAFGASVNNYITIFQ